jgi:hypothetical protein
MLAYTVLNGPLGQDVVGQFCSKIGVGSDKCDLVRLALDVADISPDKLVQEAKTKGREAFATWLEGKVGGGSATKFVARKLFDKIRAWLESEAGITTEPPKPPAINPAMLRYTVVGTKMRAESQAQIEQRQQQQVPASAAAEVFKQPLTWAIIGGVAVLGIAGFLVLRK